jgi:BirA family biotin operon repressor/biotin-[acetyl-CoA-carboxylase] ligase
LGIKWFPLILYSLNQFAKIKPNTQFIGQNIIYFKCIDSTNTTALEWAKNNSCENGTVFITDFQTNGRGQQSNIWESEPNKNLMFSVVLNQESSLLNPFLLNKITAFSLLQCLQNRLNYSPFIKIKWPNDLYFKQKKIAGILIENNYLGNKINYSVVGIGINVNQKFEKDSTINATSIYELSENEQNRMELFQEFLEIFELNLINYKTLNIENLFANALLGYSQTEVFSINNEIIEGTIVNCDEFGRLSVLINGEIKQFNHGEIKQII